MALEKLKTDYTEEEYKNQPKSSFNQPISASKSGSPDPNVKDFVFSGGEGNTIYFTLKAPEGSTFEADKVQETIKVITTSSKDTTFYCSVGLTNDPSVTSNNPWSLGFETKPSKTTKGTGTWIFVKSGVIED